MCQQACINGQPNDDCSTTSDGIQSNELTKGRFAISLATYLVIKIRSKTSRKKGCDQKTLTFQLLKKCYKKVYKLCYMTCNYRPRLSVNVFT